MDSDPEFRNKIYQFIYLKDIRKTAILSYNSGSNRPIERSIYILKDNISRMINRYSAVNSERLGINIYIRKKRGIARSSLSFWQEYFYIVLLADRVTINSQIEVSLYRLLIGIYAILSIELEMPI